MKRCCKLLNVMKNKAPLELFWVLFAMSCRVETHCILANECIINNLLDVCTYEIYQKSDPRPLVKVLNPNIIIIKPPKHQKLYALKSPKITHLNTLTLYLGCNSYLSNNCKPLWRIGMWWSCLFICIATSRCDCLINGSPWYQLYTFM